MRKQRIKEALRVTGPHQVKSELRTSNASPGPFPEYVAGFPIPEGFSPGSSYWFANSKGVKK